MWEINEDEFNIKVTNGNLIFNFEKVIGELSSVSINEKEVITSGPKFNVWKPVIDNHEIERDQMWMPKFMDSMQTNNRGVKIEDNKIILTRTYAPPVFDFGYKYQTNIWIQ